MRIISICTMAAAIVFSTCLPGWTESGQGVQLKATAQVEVKTLDAEGRTVVKRVPAKKVIPGTEVIYTIHYSNTGDQPAEHVAITNPIPEHMRYVDQSVFGSDAVITFSIDGSKTFDRPQNLIVVDPSGRSFPARPADYTHIQWVLEHPLAPGAKGQVGFRATLE